MRAGDSVLKRAVYLGLLSALVAGCSGGNSVQPPAPSTIVVSVSPSSANVILGATQQFTANVTGSSNAEVSWTVNGIAGGNATVGTIDPTGLYTAPVDLPSPSGVTVAATSQADASAFSSASVAVTSDITVTVTTSPSLTLSVPTNSTVDVAASITSQGKPDLSVNWSVNGIAGGNSTVGLISTTGAGTATYQAPATVPTPFTVTITAASVADGTKSAALPMIVAGKIASVTQTIAAASGGTIALADGSSVTIPPNALPSDQVVTLTEFSILSQQPPNQLVSGVGPSLQVSLATPIQPLGSLQRPTSSRPTVSGSAQATNAPDIQFKINEQWAPSNSLNGSLGLSTLTDTSGNSTFVTAASNFDSTTSFVSTSMSSSWLSNLGSALSSFGMGIVNSIMAVNPILIPVSQLPLEKCWNTSDPTNPNWTDFSSCLSQISGKKVLVVVHGMMSCVEEMTNPSSSSGIKPIPVLQGEDKYDLVLGFDYDWTQHVTDSGVKLAGFLNNLQTLGASQIDILAHSEGVPVSLYGASESSATSVIKNIVGLAGPITGTPIANSPGWLLDHLLNLRYRLSSNCPASLALGRIASVGTQPFQLDLQKFSDVLMNGVLPDAASKLLGTRIFLAGGENPNYQGVLNAIEGYPFGGTPNDGIVGLDSSLGYGSGIAVLPLPPYQQLFHTDLPQNGNVLDDIAVQLSNSSPKLSCTSEVPGCEGHQNTVFTFSGTGYSQTGTTRRFSQDATGTVTELSQVSNSSGTVSWTTTPNCVDPTGSFSIFSFDVPAGLASNNVMQKVTSANCTPSVPTLTSVVPTTISVGAFSLAVTGTNFLDGAQVMFGATALLTQFVSATQLTATGTAAVSQVGSVPVTVMNPAPSGGTSNPVSVTVVSTSTSSSGSTGILTGTVGGQTVDLAYVPQPLYGTVAVINVDSTSPTAALVTPIPMPTGYTPNATAANPATSQVIVISYSSPVVQLIDATKNQIVNNFPAPVTTYAGYSGGSCQICGAVIDPVSGKAILDTAQGTMLLDLTSGVFSPALPTLAAENFAFNPNTRVALLPTYGQGSFFGLQAANADTGVVAQLSSAVGSEPDAAAVDISTNIAVIPDEYTGVDYLVNMQQAVISGGTFTAPSTAFQISAPACQQLWTLASVENVSHLLFAGTEFDSCLGVAQLPTTVISGAPPTPASFLWGRMPAAPDGSAWDNGGDPHGIAVFTSVVNGKPYGFLVDNSGPWVARIDLQGLASAPALSGGYPGQIDPSPYVSFLSTQ